MLPKVSVPIATYNRAEYLDECLQSILAQTYGNIEIIVVDDGSSDHTPEIAAKFGDKIRFVQQEHRGNIQTYYHARSLCSGKYMTYFGDDDILGPTFIETAVNSLEENPTAVKFCCDCLMIDRNGDRLGDQTYLQSYTTLDSGNKSIGDLLELGCFVHGGVDRREIFEEIGYYDENFPHAADYDMYLRMTGRGHTIYYLDEPLWSYRIHPKMRSHNESEMWEETIKVLELNLERFPVSDERLRKILNRKLGMNKAWLSVRLFWEKQLSQSISYALSATKHYLPSVPLGVMQMTYATLLSKRSIYRIGD